MTPRNETDERIMTLIGNGASYSAVADILGLTKGVVTHRVRMMRDAKTREAVVGPRLPVPAPAADRTPCKRCGVRADVGCSHGFVWALAA